MTTFLWMLYLAYSLFITVVLFMSLVRDFIKYRGEEFKYLTILILIITCFLWSSWYFYYLH